MSGPGHRRGLCGVHRGCVLATDPGLARVNQQSHRPGPDTATDGDLATRPRRPSDPGRRPDPPLRRRAQYTSIRFTEHLDLEGIRPSIGSIGDAYDNALMESINGLYKAECIRTTVFHDGPYKTLADGEYATAGWVDWYNARRLHGPLANVPPIEYEQAHY